MCFPTSPERLVASICRRNGRHGCAGKTRVVVPSGKVISRLGDVAGGGQCGAHVVGVFVDVAAGDGTTVGVQGDVVGGQCGEGNHVAPRAVAIAAAAVATHLGDIACSACQSIQFIRIVGSWLLSGPSDAAGRNRNTVRRNYGSGCDRAVVFHIGANHPASSYVHLFP